MRSLWFVLAMTVLISSSAFSADVAPTEGCTNCGMTARVMRKPQTTGVSEVENSFVGPNITIMVGDTVTWTNNGMENHTTTSDQGLWDSANMKHGDMFSFTFKDTGVFPYSCTYHKVKGMRGSVTVLGPPPVITSSLTITGATNLPFRYAITGTNSPDTFTADPLPAGLVLNGNVISGIATATGTYLVTISASSLSGADTKTLVIDVIAGVAELDTDGDGFSDALEVISGSSVTDPSSTPFGIAIGVVSRLNISKFHLSIDARKAARNKLSVTGGLNPTTVPVLSGSVFTVDFGSIVKQYTLDEKGRGGAGHDSVKVSVKKPNGSVQSVSFTASITNITAPVGFDTTQDRKKVPTAISLAVIFNGVYYQTTQIVSYASKTGVGGSAK